MTFTEDWLEQLSLIMVDVNKQDRITLFVDADYTSVFYYNDSYIGTIEDAGFSRSFAGIWLSENSSRPGMRARLLGKSG